MFEFDHTISTENGRQIQILESGQPDGVPVVVHSGTPSSRLLFRHWVEDALSRGIRLIGYDRPGYGGSEAAPGRIVADAADDIAAIARALGISRLGVWGASGGGPHALACAALLPDLVAAAAALASPAAYPSEGLDWFAGMGEDNILEFHKALESREALQSFVESSAPSMLDGEPESLMHALQSLLSPVDAAVVSGDFAAFLLKSIREAIGERGDGWVDDDLAFVRPWGFQLSQIRTPVLLWHGRHDRFVPFSHGEWLARHIPKVDARLSEDDGHLTLILRRIPDVHSWLLEQMK